MVQPLIKNILQDVLALKQKDDIWSIIVDIAYVFGAFGVFIMGWLLGGMAKWCDWQLNRHQVRSRLTRNKMAILLSLIFAMTNIEGEFLGNGINFAKLYILSGLIIFCLFKTIKFPARKNFV